MKTNWKQKLSSRKFWAAIIALISAIAVAFGASEMQTNQIVGVVSSFSVLIMYIVSETISDAKNKSSLGNTDTIDWKKKLSSRKFWAALSSFIVTLLVSLGCNNITIEQVSAIIAALATVSVYILGEGVIDGSSTNDEKELAQFAAEMLNDDDDDAFLEELLSDDENSSEDDESPKSE